MCTAHLRPYVVTGDNASSRVWALSGGSGAIGSPHYGPLGIVRYLGSGSGSEEDSWNIDRMEAIWIWGSRQQQ